MTTFVPILIAEYVKLQPLLLTKIFMKTIDGRLASKNVNKLLTI
jgi:hypothetical protein